jgi:uncharacterized protein (DUF608 family)
MSGTNDGSNPFGCGLPPLPRRDFLKMAGLGAVATTAGGPLGVMAGPFGAADVDNGHLVPADKQLDPGWVRSLFERGTKEVVRGAALDRVGMPCGGIASGQLYLTGDGGLGCWQIFNNAESRWVAGTSSTWESIDIARPVEQRFELAWRQGDGAPAARPLRRTHWADVRFVGEYPIGRVAYRDARCPLEADLEAFSPFIPGEAADSALPVTVFRFTVRNTGEARTTCFVAGLLENAVARHSGPALSGTRHSEVRPMGGGAVLAHAAAPPETPPEDDAITFADFERSDWPDGWTAQGEAFADGPAKGTLPGQQPVTGFRGDRLVNSFRGGDATTGSLTSPAFTLTRRYVNFLIGGGPHDGSDEAAGVTGMFLEVDGRRVRSAHGEASEALRWRHWDVSDLQGKEARIVIVDTSTVGWGHINVDQIEFGDRPRAGMGGKLDEAPDFGTLALAVDAAGDADTSAVYPAGLPELYRHERATWPVEEDRLGVVRSADITLDPGEARTVTFVLGWHFPNAREGRFYATRFADAAEAAGYTLAHLDRLAAGTRTWRDTWYDSTLPYWLLDRLHSTVANLATGTCEWWANGRFWAWEGVTCCHGTCTHVWNYAHAHARLFPEIGRNIRSRQDFHPVEDGGGFNPDGLVGFRSDSNYAADGQCGTVLKAYREHLMAPDDRFLRAHWPRIRKALEYSIGRDQNADGLIEDSQHNTYDINYFGANTFVGSLYLAALKAGAAMAREAGDAAFAETCDAIHARGREATQRRLWNGEYYIQDVDLEEHPQHQYGHGCLSDHLFGQGWAHQVGLGYIYPEDRVKSALRAVWKYNWAPDVGVYNEEHPPFRWFIAPGQAGLFTCTWPRSAYLPQGVGGHGGRGAGHRPRHSRPVPPRTAEPLQRGGVRRPLRACPGELGRPPRAHGLRVPRAAGALRLRAPHHA